MKQKGLFVECGEATEVDQIREILDTGESWSNFSGSIHSVAEALLIFLESLMEPVIPFAFYEECISASNSAINCQSIITKLPPTHFNCFVYLMAFLRELLQYSVENELTPEKLSK